MKDKKLMKFTHKDAKAAIGVINFDHFETTIEKSAKDPTKFKLIISGISNRTFEFKAETAEKCKEWFDSIFKHIKFSDGFKRQLSAIGVKQPWGLNNMSEEQFLK